MRPVERDSIAHEEVVHELITGEAVALDLRAASFVLRAAGAIIDYVVYLGSYILLIVVVILSADSLVLDEAVLAATAVTALVLCLVVIPTAVETLTQGKSLGKLAIGGRIVREDGGSIGFRHAFIRALTGVFEIYLTAGGMAAVVALLNSRAKRVGDLVAGTYCQNERVAHDVPPVYGVPIELHEWALTADVAKMPDALARRVAQFLSSAKGFTASTREKFSRSLANEVSVFVSPVPVVDPELFLAGVAALRRNREFAALQLERAGLDRLSPVLDGMPRGFPDRG